jgi:hypothetical protein
VHRRCDGTRETVFQWNRNDTNEELVRSKVEMCKAVADEAVVVLKAMETWEERRASHDRF